MNKIKIFFIFFVASFIGFLSAVTISKVSKNDLDRGVLNYSSKDNKLNSNLGLSQKEGNEKKSYTKSSGEDIIKEIVDIIKKEYFEEKDSKKIAELISSGIVSVPVPV